MNRTLLYGEILLGLVPVPDGNEQVSPLVPGSTDLGELEAEAYDGLVMRAPANTLERKHEMALALRAVRVGAPLVILAANDKGGTRLAKELAAFGVDVTDEPKRHHRICMGSRPERLIGIEDAVKDGALRELPELGFVSQPGLFSWDRVDIGSMNLIGVLPMLSGRIGDFGCGYGLLSLAVLRSEAVTEVIGFELDRRAIAAAQMNIKDPRFSTVWVDVAAKGAGVSVLDAIVMNPPFHRAGVEDQALGVTMIGRAAAALRTGGALWLTANRHLPYEAVLKSRFKSAHLVTDADGFKVYRAVK